MLHFSLLYALKQSIYLYAAIIFRQEVPDVTEFDELLQASTTRPITDLKNIPFCESVVWDIENQGRRYVAVHFVTRYELLQEPEDSLIMIEG